MRNSERFTAILIILYLQQIYSCSRLDDSFKLPWLSRNLSKIFGCIKYWKYWLFVHVTISFSKIRSNCWRACLLLGCLGSDSRTSLYVEYFGIDYQQICVRWISTGASFLGGTLAPSRAPLNMGYASKGTSIVRGLLACWFDVEWMSGTTPYNVGSTSISRKHHISLQVRPVIHIEITCLAYTQSTLVHGKTLTSRWHHDNDIAIFLWWIRVVI